MKVAELEYDPGNTSKIFTLADGHRYYVHRFVREGKPTQYRLVSFDQMATVSPYLRAELMDGVIGKRMEPGSAADEVPSWVSPSGFQCPGCGAKVTREGVHFPPETAPPPAPAVPAAIPVPEPEPERPASAGRRSRFLKGG